MGMLVLFWRRAQKLWGRGELVSEDDIRDFGWDALVQSGWARKQEGGYYAIGAKEQFAWYAQRVEAAQAGGKAGGRGRGADSRNDDSDSRETDSDSPPAPTPAPSPALTPTLNTAHRRPRELVETAYRVYPAKKGKTRGFAKLEKEIKTEADLGALLAAIERYKRCDEVKRGFVKHFSTFAGEWREWLDADAGQVNSRAPKPLKQLADLEREEQPHAP